MKRNYLLIALASAATVALAGFTAVPHRVNYDLSGGTAENLTERINFWQTAELPTVSKQHEIFTGWTNESGESETELKFITSDVSLEANFVPEYYRVHLTDGNGNVVGTTMRKYGQVTDLMALNVKTLKADHPYENLVGWTNGSETITVISAEGASDVTLSPVFEPKQYNIAYELNGGTNADNPTTYSWNTGVESFADPSRSGYTFTGWFSDPDCTVNVNSISADSHEDVTLYAGWELIPVQTYVPSNSGYVQHDTLAVSGGSGSYNVGGGSSVSGGYVPSAPSAPAFVLSSNNASIPQIGYLVNLASYWELGESGIQAYIDMANTAVFAEGMGDDCFKGQMLYDHAYQGLARLPYRLSIGAECTINWNGTSRTYHYVGYTIAPNPFRETAYAIQSHALTVVTCVGDGNNYYVFFD